MGVSMNVEEKVQQKMRMQIDDLLKQFTLYPELKVDVESKIMI